MILLGAIVRRTGCVKSETVTQALKEVISARKADLLGLNLKAVEIGEKYIEEHGQ